MLQIQYRKNEWEKLAFTVTFTYSGKISNENIIIKNRSKEKQMDIWLIYYNYSIVTNGRISVDQTVN